MSFHNVPPNGFPDLPDVEELEAVQKDVQNLKTMKAAKADIAPEFSATSNYAVGDMVYHDGTLYKCTTVHEAAAWNADHFAAATVAGKLSELNSKFNGYIQYRVFHITASDTTNHIYDTGVLLTGHVCIGGIVLHNSNMLVELTNDALSDSATIKYRLYDLINNQVVSDNSAYYVYLLFIDSTMLSELPVSP